MTIATLPMIDGAGAAIITINFPGDLVGAELTSTFHNATAGGFRVSPSCHFDRGVVGAPGIGWDRSGCPPGNPAYLGPTVPLGSGLYVNDNGQQFGLLSLFALGIPFFAESSKGGVVTIPAGTTGLEFDFTGSDWSGIDWVLFYYNDAGVPAAGFNQLVVSVPEPSSLAVFAFSIAMLGWRRRKPG